MAALFPGLYAIKRKQGVMPGLPDWLRYTNFCKRFPGALPWGITPKPGTPPPSWWIGKSDILDEVERLIREYYEAAAARKRKK